MTAKYVEPQAPRFEVGTFDGREAIRIQAQRHWFLLSFISFWFCGWTVGGIGAMWGLMKSFNPFLVFWLGMWALGWFAAAAAIAWQLDGQEFLRIVGADLEITHSVFGFKRRRLYRGAEIRDLVEADYLDRAPRGPPSNWERQGGIKFTYGARTIYAASGLDDAEGRLIVKWLRARLPDTATSVKGQENG